MLHFRKANILVLVLVGNEYKSMNIYELGLTLQVHC